MKLAKFTGKTFRVNGKNLLDFIKHKIRVKFNHSLRLLR